MVDANRCSSLTKLFRVTALVLRFVSNFLGRKPRKSGLLTSDEIQRAEDLHVWIKEVQREKFPDEIRSLQKKTEENTLAKQLPLFLDEDHIIRCGGRLHNAPLEYDTKFPILLPSHHRFTDLVIYNARVEWSFIPKRAPWFGGFWERMIGLTKTNMKKVLGRAFVSLDELNTIVAEIESTLNDRPITYLSADSDDEMPLTPSHLLHGRTLTNVPHQLVDDDEISDPSFENQDKLKKRYLRISQLLEHFWRRWTSEYLPALREHHKLSGKTDNQIKTGDVV